MCSDILSIDLGCHNLMELRYVRFLRRFEIFGRRSKLQCRKLLTNFVLLLGLGPEIHSNVENCALSHWLLEISQLH